MVSLIPAITARGNAYEVGFQIGTAARETMRAMYAETRAEYNAQWDALLRQSIPFRDATRQFLPRVVEEMRGVADGAQIPFDDLFLMSVEELLYEEVRGLEREREREIEREKERVTPALYHTITLSRSKGCSDLAAAPPATRDGHVWLAHNNDLGPSAREQLTLTRLCVTGEPEILAVTVGGWFISIGMNNAGIALTGNQLNANDSRAGIPRLLMVRDMLAQHTLDAALKSALHPARASSYNNILSSRDGQIVNVEGSATDAALTTAAENNGAIAHTNHYLAEKMLRFEADAPHVAMSATRCARAFDYARRYHGQIDFEICARFVRDHVYAPWSVCKHAGQSVTVFSAIIDLTETKMWLAAGNPCQNEFTPHEFD